MIIFPLSVPGKIVLILVAIALGLIWSMLMWPAAWRKLLRRPAVPEQPNTLEQPKTKKK